MLQLWYLFIGLGLFFSYLTLTEGGGKKEIKKKMENIYVPTLKANYMVWPLVQVLNFRVIPLQFQLVFPSSSSSPARPRSWFTWYNFFNIHGFIAFCFHGWNLLDMLCLVGKFRQQCLNEDCERESGGHISFLTYPTYLLTPPYII